MKSKRLKIGKNLLMLIYLKKKHDIYITGSNAKLLSGELATYISGCYVEIKVYPLSFREILNYKTRKKTKPNEYKVLIDYIEYGGMPYLLGLDDDKKIQYLIDLYNSIFLKDIIKRNKIRDINLFHNRDRNMMETPTRPTIISISPILV